MGRKKDRFWEYAKESNGRFRCEFCYKDFAGGISRIKSHLSGIKGRDIDICLKVPERVSADARQAINGSSPSKKGKKTIVISEDAENVVVRDGTSSTALTCSSTRESKKKAVDEKFMKFQIASGFFKEDSCTFVEFVKAVSEFGPDYELPNWYTDPVEELVEQEDEISRYEWGVKECWRETGCTLMIIQGSDESGYVKDVKVFAYCPKGTMFLTSGPHSLILDHLVHIIDGVGAHHIVQVIDHGYCRLHVIKESYPRVLFTTCATRIFEDLFHGIVCIIATQITNIFLAARMVYLYLRSFSTEFLRKCDKYKNCDRNAANEVWLLFLLMRLETDVIRIVQSLDASSSDLAKWVADLVADTKFWKLGEQVVHIVDFCHPVFRLGISKVPAFGYLYEAVNKACNAIDECWHHDDDPTRCNLKDFCQKELRSMIKPLHAAASFLNPALFMCGGDKFIEDPLVKEGIDYIAQTFCIDEIEKVSFLDQVELYRAKTQFVFTDTALENLKALHPGVWWHRFGGSVPILQKCAIQILSQPCGVQWEILYTRQGISDTKSMKNKFLWSEIYSMEPIDLDEFTWICENVNQENLSDLDSIDNTFGSRYSKEDPLLFWLDNEHELKHIWLLS